MSIGGARAIAKTRTKAVSGLCPVDDRVLLKSFSDKLRSDMHLAVGRTTHVGSVIC